MSKNIVSLSERDIRVLERGNKVWVPINPNLDYGNLQGVVICKNHINDLTFALIERSDGYDYKKCLYHINDDEEDDSLN